MTATEHADSAAARLARRLDRAVARARAALLLELLGSGAAAAAAAAVLAAGLDTWLRPEQLWLGGSLVWLAAAGAVWWRARHLGLPARWSTRLSVASHWEAREPAAGTRISAAVGFLPEAGSLSPPPRVADACKLLAIEQADRAAAGLADARPAGPGFAVAAAGLAAAAGLLVAATLGPEAWRAALSRQLPPAVGGWPVAPLPPAAAARPLPPLRPAEVAAASRQLISLVDQCRRASSSPTFAVELEAVTQHAEQLLERLPPAVLAGIIRWLAAGLADRDARPDPVARVADLAAGGSAAVQLAAAAAVQQGLATELARLLPRQPGLRPDELAPAAARQLDRLAAAQLALAAAGAEAVAVLEGAGLFHRSAEMPSMAFSGQILGNRLGHATVAASRSAETLAAAVAALGLDIPAGAIAAGGSASGDLMRAVIDLAAVSAELNRETDRSADQSRDLSAGAAAVLREAAAAAAADGAAVAPADRPGREPAAGPGGSIAGAAVDGPVVSAAGGEPAGPIWRLATPDRRPLGRVATDRTQPAATAAAFADYLERLLPPRPAATPRLRQAAP